MCFGVQRRDARPCQDMMRVRPAAALTSLWLQVVGRYIGCGGDTGSGGACSCRGGSRVWTAAPDELV
jgi:hypothetical protein